MRLRHLKCKISLLLLLASIEIFLRLKKLLWLQAWSSHVLMQLWACNQRVSELQGAFNQVANTYPKGQIQVYQNYHFWWLSTNSVNWSWSKFEFSSKFHRKPRRAKSHLTKKALPMKRSFRVQFLWDMNMSRFFSLMVWIFNYAERIDGFSQKWKKACSFVWLASGEAGGG